MTTLRIEIEKEGDVSVLEKILNDLGFKFSFENDQESQDDISQAELFGINEGLKDMEAGRVFSDYEARERINKKIAEMRAKYSGN